jgi:hypothetical protein
VAGFFGVCVGVALAFGAAMLALDFVRYLRTASRGV